MSTIHYRDMIKVMDTCVYERDEQTFSMVYVRCDRKRGEAGKLARVERGCKCGLPFAVSDNEMRGVVNLDSRKKTGVHLRLVLEFNGKTVYW